MTQQINLYDARLRPSHELATARNLAIVAGVLLLALAAGTTWLRIGADRQQAELTRIQAQVRSEQERFAALGKQVAEQKVSAPLLGEIGATRDTLGTLSEALTLLDSGQLGNATGFSAVMNGFARQSVSDLWLTGFTVARGGNDVEIRGRLLDPARLPGYVQRLSSEAAFQGRHFSTLQMTQHAAEVPPAAGQAVAAAPGAQNAPLALPRYVEFVLRSADMAPTPEAKAAGAAPVAAPAAAPAAAASPLVPTPAQAAAAAVAASVTR